MANKRINLGGVYLTQEQHDSIHRRFLRTKRKLETFSGWVRRLLLGRA